MPRIIALVSTSVTLLPDVMETVEKLLELLRVISLAAPATNVAAPVTIIAPLSVIAPLVVTLNVPEIVEAPRSIALISFNVTLFPETIITVEKLFESVSAMSLATPAVNVAVPVTANAPESVIAPFAVASKVPDTVDAPKSRSVVLLITTLFPETIETVEKRFALSRVILFVAPAVKVAAPVTVRLSESVIAPFDVTVKSPETVDAPKSIEFVSTKVTLLAEVITTVEKSFELFKVILLADPAANVAVPVTERLPESVIAPLVVTFSVPEIVEAPRFSAFASFRVRLFPEVIETVEKLFALLSVISFAAPAAKVAAPVTTRTPESVMAPAVVTESVPETVEAPKSSAFTSASNTLFAAVTETVEKLFEAFVSVMLFVDPEFKVVVPGTISVPLCVIAPPDVTFKVPVRVTAGIVIAALLKTSDKFLSAAGSTGAAAVAFTFRIDTSRTFPLSVIVMVPPKLFAWMPSEISFAAAVKVKVVVPGIISGAPCEILPPSVKLKFPVIVNPKGNATFPVSMMIVTFLKVVGGEDSANTVELRKVKSRTFPLFVNIIAPWKSFANGKLKSEPGVDIVTVNPLGLTIAPVCVRSPPEVITKAPVIVTPGIITAVLLNVIVKFLSVAGNTGTTASVVSLRNVKSRIFPLSVNVTVPSISFPTAVRRISEFSAVTVNVELPGSTSVPLLVVVPPAVTL